MQQHSAAGLVSDELSEGTAALVERAQATRRPVSLTAADDEVAVLLDPRDFRPMEERLALLEDVYRGERELAEGRGIPHEEAQGRVLSALDG
jgi:antitoxin YefM